MKNYDVVIIGGGIGGLMTAKRLTDQNKNISVCLLEQGQGLDKRVCPIVTKKVDKCIKCPTCSIMEGLGGAGAFSDGKYVISTEYGGWLTDFLPDATVMDYIEQADRIMVGFGATTDRYSPDESLRKLCLQNDLHMNRAQIKHLGTDANFQTMKNLTDDLDKACDMITGARVTDVDREKHIVYYQTRSGEFEITGTSIIFAVGRVGCNFVSEWCNKNGIGLSNNQIDLGVRVELPAIIWEDFSKKIYEPKIWYRSKAYGDTTRMFCFNERGSVVTENTRGTLTVNGHSYKDEAKKTDNSNFALLSTIRFTQPFNAPLEYARQVASLANLISGGGVLVQRLGDLMLGRRTDEKRLGQSTTRPTLAAVPGDLSLCIPKRQLDNIIETLNALDKIAPGTANHDTLLYALECKYYSARPRCNDFEMETCQNIYAIGDGAGFTRSLSHAAANGLYVADKILKQYQK